jgi:hypothetical protein
LEIRSENLKVSESMSQKWDCITLHGMMAEVG